MRPRWRAIWQHCAHEGFSACAIVFLHGYRHPVRTSARAAEIARAAGFTQISASHETVPLMKFVSRGDTTVADAYLSPVLSRYADRISGAIGAGEEGPRLFFMTSNGGLAAPDFFRGKDAILSGPAGGVVGMAETAREAGFAARHRLRHGRHIDRCFALRWRI